MTDPGHDLQANELSVYRRLLALATVFYLGWWFAVESILPGSFNPLPSRLSVVAFGSLSLLGTWLFPWFRKHAQLLLFATVWLITFHFYYLFYRNGDAANWIVGCYITVMAINLCFLSRAALLSYSVFVLALSVALVVLIPSLAHSVFLPGLFTIVVQANIGLQSRLRLLRALAETNEQFQLLFHSTFEGILVHHEGRILNVNKSLAQMLNTSRENLIGKDATIIIHPDEREAVNSKMALADTAPYETVGVTQDGIPIEIEVRAKTFQYGKLPARLVTIQDIGDRKRAEKETIAALAMAENVRVRDEFISIASHELKTPLTSLMLQVQLMEKGIREERPEIPATKRQEEIFALMHRQMNRLTELIETMLDVSKISSGLLELERQKVDISVLVRDCAQMALPELRKDGTLQIHAPNPVEVWADAARMKQVVDNLLSNAYKYGEKRPIHVTVSLDGFDAILTVQDQGLGIAPESRRRIFDRFEVAASDRNISGLGLGLYISRQIVDAHGGTISVESQLGKGSCFKVLIPLTPVV